MATRDELNSLFQSYLDACNAHDFSRMQSFYAPTISINDVPMDAAAVTVQFEPIVTGFPDWRWEVKHLVIDGSYLCLHYQVAGTHRGVYQEVEPTGRQITIAQFTLYHVEDGKFTDVWDLADMDEVLRQIAA